MSDEKVCPYCNGTGQVIAGGQGNCDYPKYETCPNCKGTGKDVS